MRQCEGCDTPIDNVGPDYTGVTVVPATSTTPDEWWHPDCRAAEIRKRVAAATKGGGGAAKKPVAARKAADDDSEV